MMSKRNSPTFRAQVVQELLQEEKTLAPLAAEHGEQISPYLLRDVTCAYPNQVWGIDVTSIRLQTGWMYLVAVLESIFQSSATECRESSIRVSVT